MEGIIRESVKPMEKIEGIKILHVDGINGGSGGNRNVTDEVIDLALRYRVQAPMIDNLMKEIGIEGGSLGRMTDVLRDAKDISSLTRDKKGKGKAARTTMTIATAEASVFLAPPRPAGHLPHGGEIGRIGVSQPTSKWGEVGWPSPPLWGRCPAGRRGAARALPRPFHAIPALQA